MLQAAALAAQYVVCGSRDPGEEGGRLLHRDPRGRTQAAEEHQLHHLAVPVKILGQTKFNIY